MKHQEILDFWFGRIEEKPAYLKERGELWFGGSAKVDQEIKQRFGQDVMAAGHGTYNNLANDTPGSLALILLLDQFALNVYRNQAMGYLLSDRAIPVAAKALERGFDQGLPPVMKSFFYLPFEHSEELALQEKAVALFQNLAKECEGTFWAKWAQSSLDWAVRHHAVVGRFGRFPHRNEALVRESTAEETDFLKKGVPF